MEFENSTQSITELQFRQNDDIVINVDHVGKMYKLFDQPIDRLKHTLFWRFGQKYGRDFWALHDISFQVRKGEAVGIIGRNGSGKSTLLQIIAGVLQPTIGSIEVKGRVSALLELGSGFNLEYSGRENIFLSGAILGLSKEEMLNRYDDILAFADIGEFIDQPVKNYSSGMFARLAFAVAISVEPDLLIVDEILAVGDYGFQQKCVARMRKMRDNGLTLLFVSHSPDSIRSTCNYGLFVDRGQIIYWGETDQAVNLYLNSVRQQTNQEMMQQQEDIAKSISVTKQLPGKLRYGTNHVQIEEVTLFNSQGEPCRAFKFGDEICLEVNFKTYIDLENLSVSFLIRDNAGVDLMGTTTFDEKVIFPFLPAGKNGKVHFRFTNNLRVGNFGISVALNRVSKPDYSDNVLFDQIDAVTTFVVVADLERPVHYKFYNPIDVQIGGFE
jgi:lipopolysaccharide transport system ATP-binding protein